LLLLAALALTCRQAAPAAEGVPDPEDGAMTPHGYANPYFGLAYPFATGWKTGLAGPLPSAEGYYVLGSIDSADGISGNLLIAAQDMFFSPQPFEDALALVKATRQSMAALPGMQIDREPLPVTIAGRAFGRLDYSGVGLYRSLLATEIRCHIVSFVATANDPGLLDQAVRSLAHLSPPPTAAIPVCIKGYAAGDNLLRRVEPRPAAPYFARIAVRLIVGTDGGIEHIHVIKGSEEQRKNITDALAQWRLKPLQVSGKAVAVETGLTFEFRPAAQ
jgi:Gram-negative bacterial TonB protein C-terminal